MLGGFGLGEDALGSQGGSRLVTLDATTGAFSISWYGLKPTVLGGAAGAYSLSATGPRLKTRVPFANGVLDTYENGQKTYIAQPSTGALTLTGYEPVIVYTQYIPQTEFPFWIFFAGEWAWIWLIWYIQIGWFNGKTIRHITWNVGPSSYFMIGQNAWLAAPSTTQRVTSESAEIVYSMSTTLNQRLTNVNAEIVYVAQVSHHVSNVVAEVIYSLKKVLEPTPATITIAGQGATLARVGQSIDAAPGAFTLDPKTASFYRHRRITATLGTYALAGQGATLLQKHMLSASAASYSWNNREASLRHFWLYNLGTGALTLAGQSITLTRRRAIPAAAGAFTLDPQTATFLRSLRVTAITRAFSISGAATLVFTRVATAAQGSFAISGQNATLLYGRVLSATPGAFTLAPQTANLHWPLRIIRAIRGDAIQFITSPKTATLLRIITPLRTLDAAAGVILWRGRSADFLRKYVLATAQGVLAVGGTEANLRYAAGRSLLADRGSFVLSAQAASFACNRVLSTDYGTFTLASQTATMLRRRMLSVSAGAYTLAPQTASLRATATWALEVGGYFLAPKNASLVYGRSLAAAQGEYDLTLNDAGLNTVRRLVASAGAFTLAPGAVGRNRVVGLLPGAFTIAGRAALISRTVLHQTGEFVLAATDANLLHQYIPGVITTQAQFTISGNAATLARTRIMEVGTGEYTLSPTTVMLAKARQLAADQGEFVIDAADATIQRQLALNAARAVFTITGFPLLGTGLARSIVADPGEIIITGQDAVLTRRRVLTAARGAFTVDGQLMSWRYDRAMVLGTGAFVIQWKLISTIEADGVAQAHWEYTNERHVSVTGPVTDAEVTREGIADTDWRTIETDVRWE